MIKTRVTNPRPTTHDIARGIDYDAEIEIRGANYGEPIVFAGEITLAPDPYDGRLVPVGHSPDCWISGDLLGPIICDARLSPYSRMLLRSLAGGEGIEEIEELGADEEENDDAAE